MTGKHAVWIVAVLGLVSTDRPPARADTAKPAAAKVDDKADQLLRKMSAELQGMKSVQFDAEHTMEVVTKDGEKLQFIATSRVALERPNKLRSDRTGPIAYLTFYYDGSNVTLYGKKLNLYASEKAPDTIDKMIDFARDQLDLDAPAADLMYTDVYRGLMSDVVAGTYLGIEEVGDRACHHLAYRGHETDWQIWIEDGAHALPCRYVVVSKNVQASPAYTVEISNWKTDPALPASTFQFIPPPGAAKIKFFKPSETQTIGRK